MNKKGEVSLKKNPDGSQEISSKINQGSFLPPDMLKEYKEVDPALPAKLIQWANDETIYRRSGERKNTNFGFWTNVIGHVCAMSALSGILWLAFRFMMKGYAREGMWIALSIASVVGIFIIKKY